MKCAYQRESSSCGFSRKVWHTTQFMKSCLRANLQMPNSVRLSFRSCSIGRLSWLRMLACLLGISRKVETKDKFSWKRRQNRRR